MAPSTPPSPLADWRPICSSGGARQNSGRRRRASAGSIQRDDTGEVVAVEITCSAAASKSGPGTQDRRQLPEQKISMVNTYYKETMNGVELCEIDLLDDLEGRRRRPDGRTPQSHRPLIHLNNPTGGPQPPLTASTTGTSTAGTEITSTPRIQRGENTLNSLIIRSPKKAGHLRGSTPWTSCR